MEMVARRVFMLMAALAVIGGVFITDAQPAAAAGCSCVTYVRQQTGLPGGPNAAADYIPRMGQFGYREVGPTNGAILIWERNKKGAYGDGHMAIVNSVRYDSRTRKWTVTVRHANWQYVCPSSTTTFTTWTDLNNLHFYVKR